MTCFSVTTKAHIANDKSAIESLNSILKSNTGEGVDLLEMVPVIAVASLLTDVVICIERISEAVDELASLAHFKSNMPPTMATKVTKPLPLHREGTMQPIMSRDELLYNVRVHESSPKENETTRAGSTYNNG